MKLSELLAQVPSLIQHSTHPNYEMEVTGICTNSHACKPGDLFIGMPGTRVDGGEFWHSALDQGAIAAIISSSAAVKYLPTANGRTEGSRSVCVLQTPDITSTCAEVATAFYHHPTQQLKLVGVTGTNGKTTTTHLIEFFLNSHSPTALLGTLYNRWQGYQATAVHTTPFAVELQAQLAAAVKAGSQLAVMEVSSHALAQGRVKGCNFDVGVFTNLTQDHLDFHLDMEAYFAAKALLFTPAYLSGKAIINLDDPYGKRLLSTLPHAWSYSVNDPAADFYTQNLVYQAHGVNGTINTPQGEIPFFSPLVGQYNISNLLAAIATVLYLGIDLAKISSLLPHFPGVPGRMEKVSIGKQQDISVFVDYAHTPDSLENLLKASRPFIPGKMICVFGCGGDRDRTKRPQMGKIAAELADVVIVTSDNPRTENPQQILDDILAGIPDSITPIVEGDRSCAIHLAIQNAAPGDGVLIAGKGHEDYQILGTEKIHFDDREQALSALTLRISH